jgi:hypothetical protein
MIVDRFGQSGQMAGPIDAPGAAARIAAAIYDKEIRYENPA